MDFPALRVAPALMALGVAVLVACGSDDNTGGIGPGDLDGGTDSGDTTRTDVDGGKTNPPGGACGMPGMKPGFAGSQSITVGGTKRTYELYVPDAYDGKKTYPLVFVLHGDGGDGAGIRSGFKLEAESGGGAIFVYPDGNGSDSTWHIDDANSLGKDVAFIDAIAADLGTRLCSDKQRIFAVGFSKGAYFANMLGCLSKTDFRAVVAHSGGGPFGLDGSGTSFDNNGNLICPSKPVAAMQIIGTSDGLFDDARKARDYWRGANTCSNKTTAYDPSPCAQYSGCAAGRSEVYCEIPGLGHDVWQNATKAVWGFLQTK